MINKTIKKISIVLIAILFMAPITAGAITQTELQTQVNSLLKIVAKLQEQLKQKTVKNNQPTVSDNIQRFSCVDIKSNLYFGTRDKGLYGGSVRRLQEFLKNDGVYYGPISGYYGPMTRNAVKKWQVKNGVVSYGNAWTTGYGSVGPKTRKKMGCAKVYTARRSQVNKKLFVNAQDSYSFEADGSILEFIKDTDKFSFYDVKRTAKNGRKLYGNKSNCGYDFEYPAYVELSNKDKKCFDGMGGVDLKVVSDKKGNFFNRALEVKYVPLDKTFEETIEDMKKLSRKITVKKLPDTSYFYNVHIIDGELASIMGNTTFVHSIIAQPKGLSDKMAFVIGSAYIELNDEDDFGVVCSKVGCVLNKEMSEHLVNTVLNSVETKKSVLQGKLDTLIQKKSDVMTVLDSARKKARDARRIADIKQLQLALEIYYDKHTSYPLGFSELPRTGRTALDKLADEKIISSIPKDPLRLIQYMYASTDNGKGYVLSATLEDEKSRALNSDIDGNIKADYGAVGCGVASNDRIFCIKN